MGIDARRQSVPVGGEPPAGLAAAVGAESSLQGVAAEWGEAGVWLVILDPTSILPAPTTSTIGPDKRTDQVGFLAGLAAGYTTSVNGVGLAPGVEGEYAAGLEEGVRYACPRCRQEPVGDAVVVPFEIDVVVVAPDIDPPVALSAAEMWIVALGPEDVPGGRLAARVITDRVPLVLAALEALMGGEPGRLWIYSAENGGLRITDVDPQAISPGRERLLREAEVRMRLGELAVGGGA
jgi:hypothetical protein